VLLRQGFELAPRLLEARFQPAAQAQRQHGFQGVLQQRQAQRLAEFDSRQLQLCPRSPVPAVGFAPVVALQREQAGQLLQVTLDRTLVDLVTFTVQQLGELGCGQSRPATGQQLEKLPLAAEGATGTIGGHAGTRYRMRLITTHDGLTMATPSTGAVAMTDPFVRSEEHTS